MMTALPAEVNVLQPQSHVSLRRGTGRQLTITQIYEVAEVALLRANLNFSASAKTVYT